MTVLFHRTKTHADRTVRCYLTLRCDSQCDFCSAQIPQASAARIQTEIAARAWAAGINRRARSTVLAGGEPFLYSEFPLLISLLKPGFKVEIYTNLQHPVDEFISAADRPFGFLVSLHPGTDLDAWRKRVDRLADAGHGLRFHVVRAAGYEDLAQFLTDSGIVERFRTALQGDQRSGPKSAGPEVNKAHPRVVCSSRIFLFGPDGYRYHCVHKMVAGDFRAVFGGIGQDDGDDWTKFNCDEFGYCAGCDNNIEGMVEDGA